MNTKSNIESYIALGSFDGLHLGHLTLVKRIVELAKENGGRSIVYTFKNHPRMLINPENTPKLLIDNKEKVKILKDNNIDLVYFEEFDKEFMKISPKDFIKGLCKKFNVKGIIVGFNYKFGFKNLGDTKLLEELSKEYGYNLYVMEPCNYNSEVVSSTRIRKAICDGDIEEANIMLNRPHLIKGEVVHGRKIGRTIGFPTANVKYDEKNVLPKIGVYYTNVKLNNNIYKGITSVGNNPTVNGQKTTVETYILDFKDSIYGEELEILFLKRIREEKKFNSLNDLVLQLKKDKCFAENEKIIVK